MTDDTTPEPYVLAHVQEALAADPAVVELGVHVVVAQGTLVLNGRVGSDALRDAAGEVAARHAPGYDVQNDLEVLDVSASPGPPERLG